MSDIHEKLKNLREQSGLRQSQIADFLGVTQTFISKVESGERNLSVDQLERIADLYGCSVSSVEGLEEAQPLRFAFRAQNIRQEDLNAIAEISRIAINSRFMTDLLGGAHD